MTNRNLKLTSEQVALIQQALGIAEQKFIAIHKNIIENTVHVRGIEKPSLLIKENMMYFNKSIAFCDLNIAIESGALDD